MRSSPADSSAVKVYGTETLVDVYRTLLGVLGAAGYLPSGSPGAVLQGDVERAGRAAQINTFGGGVNEVQREIIASAGLGMAGGPDDRRQAGVRRVATTTGAADTDKAAFAARLKEFEGKEAGDPEQGADPVNQPMIRHWVEAIGDENPVYTQPEAAEKSVHGGIVAPPVMLQAWVMRGRSARALRAAATHATSS